MGVFQQGGARGKKMPKETGNSSDPEVLDLGGEDCTASFVIQSPAMRALYHLAMQVAGADATILIYGESGTGKELFARLVHALSGRRSKPFVPVNCGVLKGELFADKFFGHESGAFTGAQKQRKGSFELAAGGTLFLDEVGEIPVPNQVDFLRVLEEKTFRRLGGEQVQHFSARIVAATNRVLQNMVANGEFRADLFYRLNVVPVTLPPLRERPEDIVPLTEYFLALYRHRYHKPEVTLHAQTLAALQDWPWPGNVRELRNLLERLVLLCPGTVIEREQLPLEMCPENVVSFSRTGLPASLTLAAAVQQAEQAAIVRAWQEARGSKARLAQLLDISPRSLRYKLAAYALKLR